jgi:hypothetical protein
MHLGKGSWMVTKSTLCGSRARVEWHCNRLAQVRVTNW